MTISPAQAHFIKPLLGVFKRTPGADENPYFRLLKDKLSSFEQEDLLAAADHLSTNAENQTWPLLRDCIRACEAARAKRLAAENPRPNIPVPADGPRLPEAAAMRILAADVPEVALRACDGDWIVCLLEFVQDKKRVPTGREIDDCKAQTSRTDAKIEEHCTLANGSALDQMISRMINGIHAKRERVKSAMKEMLRCPASQVAE